MKRIDRMEYILQVICKTENCTKSQACKSCVEHNIVNSNEEFEEALKRLLKKGCVSIHPETELLLFKRPYSFLRQKGSVKYNGTTNRVFYNMPSQPYGRY